MRRTKELIDGKAAEDIRTAPLTAADAKGKKITKGDKKIVDSAGAANPVATCATADTTGGHDIDVLHAWAPGQESISGLDTTQGGMLHAVLPRHRTVHGRVS